MEMSAGPPFRGNRAYIGMGSNLGDSAASLRAAVRRLTDLGTIAAASPVYETDPVGYADQPDFLNAVIALDTPLEPESLLDELLTIEAEFKRERGIRYGPRTLDLDLLWYGGRELHTERLTLPHPRAHEREFVLRPLADIDPAVTLGGETAGRLLARLAPQGVRPTAYTLM
jgi:2-amino-4-hydroxy-6-hydroxymethyldihydropteridine diphosphokinase